MNIIRKVGEARRREKAEAKRAKREMRRKLRGHRGFSATVDRAEVVRDDFCCGAGARPATEVRRRLLTALFILFTTVVPQATF